MGEWSKKLGEEGESVALKLMEITGWQNIEKGLDIPCIENEKHNRKKEHGLDGLFTYKSPMQGRVLKHICVSVKYNHNNYTNSRPSKFKKYLLELNNTIECFEHSALKHEKESDWNGKGIDNAETVGLIIWLHGDRKDNSKDDLITEFKSIRIESDSLNYPIALIDQKRANFIFESYEYVCKKYQNYEISFDYHDTGQNHIDNEIKSSGQILPWEMINSGVIVYRAVSRNSDSDERNLVILSIDEFEKNSFKRLLGFAQSLSHDLANEIEISFSHYVLVEHENVVKQVKASFEDENFVRRVEVNSYKLDLRNR